MLMTLSAGALLADDFNWGGSYAANWEGFGTSPYTATDTTYSPAKSITLFCLDFNNEIAPPFAWTSSVIPLSSDNVTNAGAYQNVYAAQYGGSYNGLLNAAATAAGKSNPPQVYPFAYMGYGAVNLSKDDAYTRYLEAAWLFSDILQAVGRNPRDIDTDMIAQAAAWELFVNASNLGTLTGDVQNYGSGQTFTFTNYLALTTQSTSGTFQQSVDAALLAAQNAVDTLNWGPGSPGFGNWSIVTGTPDYVVGFGRPVQEFLSPDAMPDSPPLRDSPVPEPKAIFLLAPIAAILLWTRRRRRTA